MLNIFKELFTKEEEAEIQQDETDPRKLQVAACALLMEIANADDNFTAEEKMRIVEIMKSKFKLNDTEIAALLEQSKEEMKNSVSVYEFTDIVNKYLSQEEKFQIVKSLWEIAFADGKIDEYEDYYIKKISNNLHLHHKERIAAKMEVKKNLKESSEK